MMLPCKIVVEGTPATVQSKSHNKNQWKDKVTTEGKRIVSLKDNPPPVDDDIDMSIFYYFNGNIDRDTDNIIKPIQDALNNIVYVDDNQIKKINAESRSIYSNFDLKDVSAYLMKSFRKRKDFVSINVIEYQMNTKLV